MEKKILICGDSYCVTDPEYVDLHWSEKILNFSPAIQVFNLAYGGSSNAMIVLQLLQGLNLDPDFVILSFTTCSRYEIDKDINALPTDLSDIGLANYQKARYTTTMYEQNREQNQTIAKWMSGVCSENFEKLKNYFYIGFCLLTLREKKIPFAFSLGGFEYDQDYTSLIKSNYMYNFIPDYVNHELKTNLWFYGQKQRPWFHVDDDRVQSLFANECLSRINALTETKC